MSSDKEFYDNQNKAIEKIRTTAEHYNIGVIEADTAMIQLMGTLAELDRKVNEIVEKVQE